MTNKILWGIIIGFILIWGLSENPGATTGGTAQVSPVANLSGSNASVVNNNFQMVQNGVNAALYLFQQYFPGGIVQTVNGGTGANLSQAATGDTLVMAANGTVTVQAPIVIPPVTSNVLFQYHGYIDSLNNGAGSFQGEYIGSSLVGQGSANYRYLQSTGGSYLTIWTSQFIKIAGINTVTIWGENMGKINLSCCC